MSNDPEVDAILASPDQPAAQIAYNAIGQPVMVTSVRVVDRASHDEKVLALLAVIARRLGKLTGETS